MTTRTSRLWQWGLAALLLALAAFVVSTLLPPAEGPTEAPSAGGPPTEEQVLGGERVGDGGRIVRRGPEPVEDTGPQGLLVQAAAGGDTSGVLQLLEEGASTDVADANGWFALHKAAENGHGDTVEALLELGASIGLGDNVGYTPLIWAASSGHLEIVERLLEAGADPNAQHPPNESTALAVCLLAWLLAADIFPRPPDVTLELNRDARVEIARTLLAAGADPNPGSPIMSAAMTGDAEVLRLLIDHGAALPDAGEMMMLPLPDDIMAILQEAREAQQASPEAR